MSFLRVGQGINNYLWSRVSRLPLDSLVPRLYFLHMVPITNPSTCDTPMTASWIILSLVRRLDFVHGQSAWERGCLPTRLAWTQLLIRQRLGQKCLSGVCALAWPITRGSHLYVPCRSICDRNQNRIKRSKHFLRANQGIKGTSKLRKSRIKNARLQFDLWPVKNQVIKGLRRADQATKHTFCRSKILIPVANTSTGDI